LAMGRDSAHDRLADGIIHADQPDLTSLPAAAPWPHIWTHLSGAVHPPLYFILLRWWIDLSGNGPGATRALSVVFSLAAIPLLFDACRLLHGGRVALLAAAIMAVAVAQLDYAQETRGYALLILLTVAAADALIRIEKLGASARRLVVLGAAMAGMALTHYESAGALAALAVYAAVRLRGRARARTFFAIAATAILVLAVWGPWFYQQVATIHSLLTDFWSNTTPTLESRSFAWRLVSLPAQYLCGEQWLQTLPRWLIVASALLTLILPTLRVAWKPQLLLWVLLMWGTILFVAVTDLIHHTTSLQYVRYTLAASPGVYAVLAATDWPPRPFVRDLAPLCAVAALCLAGIKRLDHPMPAKEDWAQFARFVDTYAQPDDLLVFFNESNWVSPGTWYMGFKYYAPQSDRPWMTLHQSADAQTLRRLAGRRSLWLIGMVPEDVSPQVLPGWRPIRAVHTTAAIICRMSPANAP
jgi:mannosyltransferase